MATAPVFAPDGTLGDIPVGNLPAALKAGFKPGVTMKSADGKLGVIPADRVPDAAKSGLQIVPLDQQETQHPGFWSAVGSDISAMVPHSLSDAAKMEGKSLLRMSTLGMSDLPEMVQSAKERMATGHGVAYTAGAGANEALGVNVKGEEQAAAEGDVAGVAGHAATVPMIMAATAGLAKGADAISEHPAFVKASNAIKNVTPKQAATVAGGIGGVAAGHGLGSILTGEGGAYGAGRIAETLLGKTRANQPMFGKPATPVYPGAAFPEPADAALGRIPVNQPTPVEQSAGMASGPQSADINPKAQVYRDATRQNVPYAGELDEMTDRLAKQVAEKKGKTAPDQADHTQAASVLQDALKTSTDDVVDSAIKPGGENHGANLQTKAEVDFHLQRGDIAGAEQALDAGRSAAYQPGVKYHQQIPEVTRISPSALKPMDAGEVSSVSPEVAAKMDFSEPVDVSVFKDGEMRVSDGHHRVAAAKQLGLDSIPVRLQAINADGQTIKSLISDPVNELFQQRQGKVPSTMEIRQKLDAANQFDPSERWNDQKLDAQMQDNLDRHQWSAESEARREFIARNTTGFTKTWGTQAQRDAAHASAMASESGDMTDLLQKSLEQAQNKKAQ